MNPAARAPRYKKFVLVRVDGSGAVEFNFPKTLSTERRANWSEVDTTTGVQPLTYANLSPRRLQVDELWLDRTNENQSIEPDIETLFAFQDEGKEGHPPVLIAMWGDRFERAVLTDVKISEEFFAPEGFPMRAKVNLTLLQIQQNVPQYPTAR